MKIFKNINVKILSIVLLVVGGGIFFMLLPKFFSMILTKIVDAIPTEPIYDSEGKMIHQDWMKTIRSFGNRKQFAVEKCGVKGDISWFLSDLDKNKDIDKIRYFTRPSSSPCVYTLGEKGYTKLNYETTEIIQSKDINDFSGEDKGIFEKLERIKSQAKDDQEKSEVSWE